MVSASLTLIIQILLWLAICVWLTQHKVRCRTMVCPCMSTVWSGGRSIPIAQWVNNYY